MSEIQNIVKAIQEKFFDNTATEDKYLLRYTEEAYIEAVELIVYEKDFQMKIQLWDSENEVREWIEEESDYEPFEDFLRKRLGKCVQSLCTAKIILE